jgi:Rad3-related DNA helicase
MQVNNKNIISPSNITTMNCIEIHISKVELDKLLEENAHLRQQRDDLLCQMNKITNDNMIYMDMVKQKDKEIEMLHTENEKLRIEVNELKNLINQLNEKIKEQDVKIKEQDVKIKEQDVKIKGQDVTIKELKDKNITSAIRIAINDLDSDTKNKIDQKYDEALDELYYDRIVVCHYLDKKYSSNAMKYGKYLLLQKLKSLCPEIITEIDGLDQGFVDAVIKSIETEKLDMTDLVVDNRQKYRIDKYWN